MSRKHVGEPDHKPRPPFRPKPAVAQLDPNFAAMGDGIAQLAQVVKDKKGKAKALVGATTAMNAIVQACGGDEKAAETLELPVAVFERIPANLRLLVLGAALMTLAEQAEKFDE